MFVQGTSKERETQETKDVEEEKVVEGVAEEGNEEDKEGDIPSKKEVNGISCTF